MNQTLLSVVLPAYNEQEVLPLTTLSGRELPSREMGGRLLAAYRERVAAGGE